MFTVVSSISAVISWVLCSDDFWCDSALTLGRTFSIFHLYFAHKQINFRFKTTQQEPVLTVTLNMGACIGPSSPDQPRNDKIDEKLKYNQMANRPHPTIYFPPSPYVDIQLFFINACCHHWPPVPSRTFNYHPPPPEQFHPPLIHLSDTDLGSSLPLSIVELILEYLQSITFPPQQFMQSFEGGCTRVSLEVGAFYTSFSIEKKCTVHAVWTVQLDSTHT